MNETTNLLPLFDANCMIGRSTVPRPGEPQTAEDLLRVMDRFGIAEALVFHAQAKELSPLEGNPLLLEEIKGHDRLRPMAVVMPGHTGEFPPADKHVAELFDQGFRAVRMFPPGHFFSLALWSCGELCFELAARRMPLFLDFENPAWSLPRTDWDAIAGLLAAFAALPIVLVREGMAVDRNLQALMARHENLYIETSYYSLHRGLELLAERPGAERALFGTGLPRSHPGAPIAQLTYAELSPEQKALIAGGNLRRLLDHTKSRKQTAIGFGVRPRRKGGGGDWPTDLAPPSE
jgi:hypothetical protein